MQRCSLPACAVITFAVLLAPQFALAGPIGWSYSADTSAGTNGRWAGFGIETRTTLDPVTGAEINTPYVLLGDIGRVASGTVSG